MRGLLPIACATCACALVGSCTLTSSLDDLRATASNGTGGGDGSVGGAGNGGAFPGGSGGSAGADAAGGSAGSTPHDPPWWDPAWSTRVQLFAQNQSALPLATSFELGFEVDPAVFAVDTVQVVQWLPANQSWDERPTFAETVNGKVWVWTPLPNTLSPTDVESSLYLYIGGPANYDPDGVFKLWDPFDGTSGEWALQGAATLGGGVADIPHDSSIRSAQQWSPGHAVDYSLTVETAISIQDDWISAGFQRTDDFDNTEPWIIWVSRTQNLLQPEVEISAAGAQGVGATQPFALNEQHFYSVERFPTKAVFRRANQIEDSIDWTTPHTTDMQIRFTTQSISAHIRLDFVRLRQVSDPPPLVTTGAVQMR